MSGSTPTYTNPGRIFRPIPALEAWAALHAVDDKEARRRFLDVCTRLRDVPDAPTCAQCGRVVDGRNTGARSTPLGTVTCTKECTRLYFGRD